MFNSSLSASAFSARSIVAKKKGYEGESGGVEINLIYDLHLKQLHKIYILVIWITKYN